MAELEFYLCDARPADAKTAAAIIVETANGLLDSALAPVQRLLGFESSEELIAYALLQGESALKLENVCLIKTEPESSVPGGIVGLCCSYPLEQNALLFPKIASEILSAEGLELLQTVLPGSVGLVDSAVDDEQNAAVENSSVRHTTAGGCLYLNTLWVHESCRGQHLGSLLLSMLQVRAQDLNCSRIVLHCFNDNHKAQSFYQKQGFVNIAACSYPESFAKLHPAGGSLWLLQLDAAEQGGGNGL